MRQFKYYTLLVKKMTSTVPRRPLNSLKNISNKNLLAWSFNWCFVFTRIAETNLFVFLEKKHIFLI